MLPLLVYLENYNDAENSSWYAYFEFFFKTRLHEGGFVSLFFYLYLCSWGIDDIGLIALVIDFGMKQRVLVSVLFDGESPCPACC